MGEARRAGQQGGELAAGAGLGIFFQRGAAGHHQGDDRAGQALAERQRAEDRHQGDDIDPEHAAAQLDHDVARHHRRDQRGRDVPGPAGEVRAGGGGGGEAGGQREQHEPKQQAAQAAGGKHEGGSWLAAAGRPASIA